MTSNSTGGMALGSTQNQTCMFILQSLTKVFSFLLQSNLIALYGLYEREIERWLPVAQRDNFLWCPSVRKGMEHDRFDYHRTDGGERVHHVQAKGKRYTPREFTTRVYNAKSLDDLKTELCGIPVRGTMGRWSKRGERRWDERLGRGQRFYCKSKQTHHNRIQALSRDERSRGD